MAPSTSSGHTSPTKSTKIHKPKRKRPKPSLHKELTNRVKQRQTFISPADQQTADPTLANDIDLMILDYTTHNTITTLCGQNLILNSPLTPDTFKAPLHMTHLLRHRLIQTSTSLPAIPHFRLRLLQFSNLFYRSQKPSLYPGSSTSPALSALRASNRLRAQKWWNVRRSTYSQPSPTEPDDADVLARQLSTPQPSQAREPSQPPQTPLPAANTSASTTSTDTDNTTPHPTLLDLLPLFIALVRDRAKLISERAVTSEQWLRLAVDFMVFAFLEQKDRGASAAAALLEAFAWGPVGGLRQEGDGGEGMEVHDVFRRSVGGEGSDDSGNGSESESGTGDGSGIDAGSENSTSADTFLFLRDAAIRELSQLSSQRPSQGEMRLSPGRSKPRFLQQVWGYLWSLAESMDKPVLAQLEHVQGGQRTTIDYDGRKNGCRETERLRRVWVM